MKTLLTITESSIREKLKRAKDYLERRQYQEAISCYSRAIFLDPDNPQLFEQLSSIYEMLKDYSTAVSLLKRSFRLSNRPEAQLKIKDLLLRRGFALLQIGEIRNILLDLDCEEFIKDYEEWAARTLYTTSNQQLKNAFAYIQAGNKSFALEELGKAVDSGDFDALALRAKLYWSLGKEQEGNSDFWRLKQLSRDSGQAMMFIRLVSPKVDQLLKETRFSLIENNISKCLLNIKRGLEIYPNNVDFLIMRAFIHRKRGEHSKAIEDVTTAYRECKEPAKMKDLKVQLSISYNEVGMECFRAKQFDKALSVFDTALGYNPDDWGILANRGDCFKSMGKSDLAIKEYQAARKAGGDRSQIIARLAGTHVSRGVLFFNKRLLREAKLEFVQAVKYASSAPNLVLLAKTHIELGELKDALKCLQSAKSLDPNNYEIKQMCKSLGGD